MTAKSYQKTAFSLLKATSQVAEESMKDAANELRGDSTKPAVDVGISADGS